MPPAADACKPPAAKTAKLGPKQRNELKELKKQYEELAEEASTFLFHFTLTKQLFYAYNFLYFQNRRLQLETPDEKLEEVSF